MGKFLLTEEERHKKIGEALRKFQKISQKAREEYNKITKPAYKDFLKAKDEIYRRKK